MMDVIEEPGEFLRVDHEDYPGIAKSCRRFHKGQGKQKSLLYALYAKLMDCCSANKTNSIHQRQSMQSIVQKADESIAFPK